MRIRADIDLVVGAALSTLVGYHADMWDRGYGRFNVQRLLLHGGRTLGMDLRLGRHTQSLLEKLVLRYLGSS